MVNKNGKENGPFVDNQPWNQLRCIRNAKAMLILPCNAAACVGNYFRAEIYRANGRNTWREADIALHDLRKKGLVLFSAVDSSILETQPEDLRGAIVLETEMHRVRNPDGEDWGAPTWRFFRPSASGKWTHLVELTKALIRGIKRVENLGMNRVLTLVNPRAYFLALAAAAHQCGVLEKWTLFRIPAHPRYLPFAVQEIAPFVRFAASKDSLPAGGIYHLPKLLPNLKKETIAYRDKLPAPFRKFNRLPTIQEAVKRWEALDTYKRENRK